MQAGNADWILRVWRRLFGHWLEYTTTPVGPEDLVVGSGSGSRSSAYGLGDDSGVKVLYIGKDTARSVHRPSASRRTIKRRSCYNSNHGDVLYTSLFSPEAPVSEDAVPYLDDCNDEQMAAYIARRQSLLRRKLRRVGFMFPQHTVEALPVL